MERNTIVMKIDQNVWQSAQYSTPLLLLLHWKLHIFFNYSGINGYHICFKASELGGKSGDSSEDETECSLYW